MRRTRRSRPNRRNRPEREEPPPSGPVPFPLLEGLDLGMTFRCGDCDGEVMNVLEHSHDPPETLVECPSCGKRETAPI